MYTLVLVLFQLLPIVSEEPAPLPQRVAMKKLDHWVGTWSGSGWSIGPTGQRIEFTLTEVVQHKVLDTVLLLEGHGTRKGTRGEESITHAGLTVVHFDPKTSRYLWNGHDHNRGAISTELQQVEGGYAWSIQPQPGGPTIRFTIHLKDNRWHEIGEVSVDGKTWTQIMDVTLTRQ